MRIIGGRLSGRVIEAPSGHRTHPMSEKIRGALFSILGDIYGLSVLDAYSGSGAIGLEASSRGAARVILIERDKHAQASIDKNIQELDLRKKIKLISANVTTWSDNNATQTFDVVILDPPYNEVKSEILDKLARHVVEGGILVLSLPPEFTPKLDAAFSYVKEKKYGDAKLVFFRRIS